MQLSDIIDIGKDGKEVLAKASDGASKNNAKKKNNIFFIDLWFNNLGAGDLINSEQQFTDRASIVS